MLSTRGTPISKPNEQARWENGEDDEGGVTFVAVGFRRLHGRRSTALVLTYLSLARGLINLSMKDIPEEWATRCIGLLNIHVLSTSSFVYLFLVLAKVA